jgi:hypothetical protein
VMETAIADRPAQIQAAAIGYSRRKLVELAVVKGLQPDDRGAISTA